MLISSKSLSIKRKFGNFYSFFVVDKFGVKFCNFLGFQHPSKQGEKEC